MAGWVNHTTFSGYAIDLLRLSNWLARLCCPPPTVIRRTNLAIRRAIAPHSIDLAGYVPHLPSYAPHLSGYAIGSVSYPINPFQPCLNPKKPSNRHPYNPQKKGYHNNCDSLHYYLLPITYSYDLQLTTYNLQLTTYNSQLTTHNSQLTS